ncbi:outer membrane lipoprotein chaperone LolA [Agitococcus lubricus]|uniref:Outer-membrane lipoprotein carrier protein n=1 Tax=Agitococcus lubricus TaxID=1077255 RepID=A0A2T5IWM3_9GAMM|nr:outer membrane lipoprotein chaperone LolA [Agitococcus lubricus]PTQ88313.1 outer membrane lipoprotein carrier protein [Agitococcus lubricus]
MRYMVLLAAVLSQVGHTEELATKNLNQLLGQIVTMRAHFDQHTLDAKNKPLQQLAGEMQVKRPGYFRWETQQPFNQLIVANGQTVWIYDPDLQQATKQKLDKQVGNTPALLLSGDSKKIAASFNVSQEKTTNKQQRVFILQPKDKEAVFDTLRVSFIGKQLNSMQLKDALGQRTDIFFSQVAVNGKISDSVFQFTPPKDVDVIDE